ncbi:MAG: methyltransferase domain-containing protein [Actinomycetota bacterium]|nr:methyltransferase domain-containing protein [Actinomycetota bacterium]
MNEGAKSQAAPVRGVLGRLRAAYEELVLPAAIRIACSHPSFGPWRERALASVSGDVVEIGFGSGENLSRYPGAVRSVAGVEPSARALRASLENSLRAAFPVTVHRARAESMPFASDSFDSAVATFCLCSVEDPAAALSEIARVLRPGGRLHFLEHGLSPEPRVAAWQRRLDPIERAVAGGCNLSRDPRAMLEAAGFEVLELEEAAALGPKPWGYLYRGVARPIAD